MLLQSLLRPVLTPLMRGMFDAPIFSSAPWSPLALCEDDGTTILYEDDGVTALTED